MRMDAILVQATPIQRVASTGAFVVVGLVIAAQISQLFEEQPAAWTRLTARNRSVSRPGTVPLSPARAGRLETNGF